jgi:cytochrome c peroxidase
MRNPGEARRGIERDGTSCAFSHRWNLEPDIPTEKTISSLQRLARGSFLIPLVVILCIEKIGVDTMFLLLENSKRSRLALNNFIAVAALLCGTCCLAPIAVAQGPDDPADYAWQPGAINHAQRMRAFFDRSNGQQVTPPLIPQFEVNLDPFGFIATLQPGGATQTSQNAFFANLGTNQRTCFSCHQPQTGWTVSAASVQARFLLSEGADPIFRLVDGATCPSDDVSNFDAKVKAYHLLLEKGLIRIGLQVPAVTVPPLTNPPTPPVPTEYRIVSVNDPYGCNTNFVTGLTNFGPGSPTTGVVSVYRRPLPSTNLRFLTTFMWDGRELNLTSQAIDATLIHAQANAPPTLAQQQQIVAFESGIFTGQIWDFGAHDLTARGATGGPGTLVDLGFFVGINDPLKPPPGTTFTSQIFDLYQAWNNISGEPVDAARDSIARGEALFNNTNITITDVAGLNDTLGLPQIAGFCGTRHDTPDVGNHSVKLPLNIGIANGGPNNDNPGLDIGDLPVFTLACVSGPNAGKTYTVTDPGRALITGFCADIGKVKGPILRGLAGRAPYFHNGSAATLLDVVNFYVQRFNLTFTDAQKADLVAFLNTL